MNGHDEIVADRDFMRIVVGAIMFGSLRMVHPELNAEELAIEALKDTDTLICTAKTTKHSDAAKAKPKRAKPDRSDEPGLEGAS